MPTKFPPAFDAFVAPARPRAEIWRTLLGLVLFAALLALLAIGLFLGLFFALKTYAPDDVNAIMAGIREQRSILSTFVMLGAVTLILPALWPVVRFLHKRPFFTLIAPDRRINWTMWAVSAGIFLLLGAISAIITLVTEDVHQQMPLAVWAMWVIPLLPVLFLQTMAEEVLFRGYLQQQLAARFQSRWIWMVLPAALFGLGHYNPEIFGANTWMVMANAFVMGLIAADLTARMGNLSASMGLHFANNLMVAIFLNIDGQMSGLSLFTFEMRLDGGEMAVQLWISIVSMLFFYGVFVVIHSRRRM